MSYIFIDKKHKAYGKIEEDKVTELKFYDETKVGNIYRAKITGRLKYMNAYFLQFEENEIGFLKSKEQLQVGCDEIVQVVRDKSNRKYALLTRNYKLETNDYYLKRYSKKKNHIYFKTKNKDRKQIDYLIKVYNNLLDEENFNPTPKLLYEKSQLNQYIQKYSDLKIEYVDIFQNRIINEAIKLANDKKIYIDENSLIIDELETLTVIDINSSKQKDDAIKEVINHNINRRIAEFLLYLLKLRNIGGMVVIDFLRTKDNKEFEKYFKDKLEKSNLEVEVHGFSDMGLFELSIKRNGESLKKALERRKFANNL
ncbi:MAG: ribonuclease E/G [Tissierellia bacterium]|nr:ribonuclease E/G [Tissierellia bacterium]